MSMSSGSADIMHFNDSFAYLLTYKRTS